MKDFFKSLFASLLALGLFSGLIFMFLIALAAAGGPKVSVPNKAVLVFDLSTNIPDSARESGPGEALQQALSGRENATPLYDLIKALDRAAKDNRIAALYLTGNPQSSGYGSGPAALKELKEAIARFKTSGKPVLAYNLGWSKRAYYLCAGTGKVMVNGKEFNSLMPPMSHLADDDLANILTYVRNSWGNAGDAVTAKELAMVRASTKRPPGAGH